MSVNSFIQQPEEPAEKQQGKRQVQRFRENPFIEPVSVEAKTRTRRVTTKSGGSSLVILSTDTGEIHGPAGFWYEQDVDSTQFVKLYVNGVKAFKKLTGAGTKVFEVLYMELQKNIGKDRVILVFGEIDQAITPMVERTFYRGVAELLEKGFIAASLAQGSYFVNPDYVWNGNRLAFVQSYRLKQTAKRVESDTKTLDLFNQEQNEVVNSIIAGDNAEK